MSDTRLPAVTIRGVSIDIYVNDQGVFSDEDHEHEAPTLEALKAKLTKTASKKKVAIEATLQTSSYRSETAQFENVIVTGWHSRNRTPLIRGEDGKAITGIEYSTNLLTRLSALDIEEASALEAAAYRAKDAWHEWQNSKKLNARDALREAGFNV